MTVSLVPLSSLAVAGWLICIIRRGSPARPPHALVYTISVPLSLPISRSASLSLPWGFTVGRTSQARIPRYRHPVCVCTCVRKTVSMRVWEREGLYLSLFTMEKERVGEIVGGSIGLLWVFK